SATPVAASTRVTRRWRKRRRSRGSRPRAPRRSPTARRARRRASTGRLDAFSSRAHEGVVMPVTRLNHAVLYVRDVAITREFYENALGFQTKIWMPGQGAFFRAPGSTSDHDRGTFQIGSQAAASGAGRTTVGLYHLAWEVDTLSELQRLAGVLQERGSLVGASDHAT